VVHTVTEKQHYTIDLKGEANKGCIKILKIELTMRWRKEMMGRLYERIFWQNEVPEITQRGIYSSTTEALVSQYNKTKADW